MEAETCPHGSAIDFDAVQLGGGLSSATRLDEDNCRNATALTVWPICQENALDESNSLGEVPLGNGNQVVSRQTYRCASGENTAHGGNQSRARDHSNRIAQHLLQGSPRSRLAEPGITQVLSEGQRAQSPKR